MNSTKKTVAIVIPILLCQIVNAAPIPAKLAGSLSQKEKQFDQSTFHWQMSYKEIDAGESAQEISEKQKAVVEHLPDQLKSLGITDKAGIDAQVKAMVDHIAEAGQGATFSSSTDWAFIRKDAGTLVSGIRQLDKLNSKNSTAQNFRQYYSGTSGLIFNDTVTIDGQPVKPIDPVVWANSSDSIRLPNPAIGSLGIEPEHFVLLMALNPLSIYSNAWHLSSETPKLWKLEAVRKQTGTPPVSIKITLSKSHGNLPEEIEVNTNSGQGVVKALVTEYSIYKGLPVVSRVVLTEHESSVEKIQTWHLISIQPSTPISLAYSGTNPIHDFRLAGTDLPQLSEGSLTKQEAAAVVLYRWPGHLPSLDELKKMYQKQHPGEAAPDPGQSSSASPSAGTPVSASNMISSALPFAGGVLCLVGGVWMLKNRRTE